MAVRRIEAKKHGRIHTPKYKTGTQITIAQTPAYQIDRLLNEVSQKRSGLKSAEVFDSTIVRVEAKTGIVRYRKIKRVARLVCRPKRLVLEPVLLN